MELFLQEDLNFSTEHVWAVMSNFGDLSWNAPMVESVTVEGEGIGMLRHVQMAGAPEPLVQRLVAMDHEKHTFSFRLVRGMQVELANYCTWIQLEELSPVRCRMIVKLHFDEPPGTDIEELRFLFEDSVRSSLGRLRYHLEHQPIFT